MTTVESIQSKETTSVAFRAKDLAEKAINVAHVEILQLSHAIHANPELAFREFQSAKRITDFLVARGFKVRTGVYGFPTAFIATVGTGPLHIALCAEYDALPPSCLYDRSKLPGLTEIWLSPERQDTPHRHACGHNLITGAAVAAAIGLQDIAEEVGLKVSLFGTPGEEFIGLPETPAGILGPGKAALFEAGAFEGVHAAMMVHPFPTPFGVILPSKAHVRRRALFSIAGTHGHTIGRAELQTLEEALKTSISSLNLVPILYVARPETGSTGAQSDIVWYGSNLDDANRALKPVQHCFEKVASSAGVIVEIMDYLPFPEMRHDPMLASAYRRNAETLGRMRGRDEKIRQEIREMFNSPQIPSWVRIVRRLFPSMVSPPGLFMSKYPVKVVYGTDLANVSQTIPAIHPFVGIGGTAAPHSAEFAARADTDEAYRAMLDGGLALAWTALDAATDPTLRSYLLNHSR